ncbi:unknown protein [Seminavis robusta]|uniref:Uncharacterized protein n=1 Tax=Seminavis robusta TaxID=568900 RepID=A0A9N8HEK3_9STRA|nr:unknown protein [Seminavis robusta]|eukprot:Sro410_g137500.1 n/a (176) ;mRNA; f:61940-62620
MIGIVWTRPLVGSKLRILKGILSGQNQDLMALYSALAFLCHPKSLSSMTMGPPDHQRGLYDVFISHRHEGGEDLAQAINQVATTGHVPRKESTNLSGRVLERPYCQSEIKVALGAQKTIILVHDVKNCVIPKASTLPVEIRPVLERVTIPYFREHAFRETAMREIAKAMKIMIPA